MEQVDFIVVGLGIAGISLCEQLERNGKTYITIANNQPGATAKSGGVLNPTVLKRFNAAWKASEFYPAAISLYGEISKRIQKPFLQEKSILRIFRSVEEQNNWTVASDKRELVPFLSPKFILNENPNIHAPLGFGEVLGTAQIDTDLLLNAYRIYLTGKNRLLTEDFDYTKLEIENDMVSYMGLGARKIVFCDGMGAVNNPFFSTHSLIPNKGEYLIIKAPKLNLHNFLKGPLYIIPLSDSLYKVGATFGQGDNSTHPTAQAMEEIVKKLRSMILCNFEVVEQTTGIRPTTKDRKPILGCVPKNPNVFFLNGLGSRGFTMAPLLSEILVDNMVNGTPIPPEMDINRMLMD